MICPLSSSDEQQCHDKLICMATKKEVLEQSQKAIADFFQLSKYLLGEDAPYDVNEIPMENPFYETARSISEEMGLSWDNMEHNDSNRVMLNLLTEYFCAIKPDDKYDAILTISFKKAE